MAADKAALRKAANEWLKEFSVTLKNISLYSERHPRGQDSLARSLELLKPLLEGRPATTLARVEGRLTLEKIPLERSRVAARRLHDDLEERGVQSIEFGAGTTLQEYAGFVRCLLLTPDRIHDRGGLESILLDEGIGSITVNRSRIGKVPDTMDLIGDLTLMDLLAGAGAAPGGESMATVLSRDPEGLARVLAQAAERRDPAPQPGDPEFRSEQIAESLERMAQRAIEDDEESRPGVLDSIGKILAATPPGLQARILTEKVGARSRRPTLTAAAEAMPAETLAEIVTAQRREAGSSSEYETLGRILSRSRAWREDREKAVRAMEESLQAGGQDEGQAREFFDHLMWAELDLSKRLHLLAKGDNLWKVDFRRVKEVLVKLFGTDQIEEAAQLVHRYLGAMESAEPETRRTIAENSRYALHLIEKTGKGFEMIPGLGERFLSCLRQEADGEAQSRLAAGLGFLADLRLRGGELEPVLDLMRAAEKLASEADPAMQERGGRLQIALSRVGNPRTFKDLTDRHLEGEGRAVLQASEILRRAGLRAVEYLVDRLAEEEDRGHRARLVSLMKEMESSAGKALAARLKDPRWFLVRNVVHILGELGDPSAIPSLRQVRTHPDPRVRKEAVRSFMRLGGSESEDLIIDSISDPDRTVQVAAVNALSVLRGRRSPGIILEILGRAGPYSDAAPEVRQEAMAAAGRMALPAAVDALAGMATRKGLLGYAEPVEIRLAAVLALGGIGDDRAMETLRIVAQSDGKREVRRAAEEILSAKGWSEEP